MDVQQPQWQCQWENYIPEHERSPTPGREPITRKSMREKKSAIQNIINEVSIRKLNIEYSIKRGIHDKVLV